MECVNWSLSCSWLVAECKKYRVIARRPLWADVAIPRYNEKIRCAGMSKVCPKMYLFCGISVYKHFTGRLPRRFAPRNDMVVVTRLRRFQQSDKLKFERFQQCSTLLNKIIQITNCNPAGYMVQ